MVSALLFPIFPFVLQLCVFVFFVGIAMHLASWGLPNCRRLGIPANESIGRNASNASEPCDCEDLGKPEEPFCIFVNYSGDNYVGWMQAGNLFGFFWVICFIDALGQLTLAGAFASYYWAFRKPEDIPTFPLLRGFWRAIR